MTPWLQLWRLLKVSTVRRRIVHRLHFKEASWVVVGQAGVTLAALLTVKVLTTLLPPATYGEYNLLLVAMLLPSGLLLAPLSQAATRWYAAEREKGCLGDLLWTVIPAYLLVSSVASILCFIFGGLGLLDRGYFSRPVFGLAAAIFFVDSVIALGVTLASASRQRKQFAILTILTAWARLLCILLGIKIFGNALIVLLSAYFLGSLIVLCYMSYLAFAQLKMTEKGRVSGQLLRRMTVYGIPFGIWSGFAWIQQYVDRYVVELVLNFHIAGAYIASLQVASLPFNLAGGVLSQFLTPIIYEHAGDGSNPERVQIASTILFKALALFALIGGMIAITYLEWGEGITRIFTHKSYLLPSSILFVLALGALVFNLAQQMTLLMLAKNFPYKLMWAKIIPGFVSLPIVWLSAEKFGLLGVGVAYLIVNLIFLSIVMVSIKKLVLSQRES